MALEVARIGSERISTAALRSGTRASRLPGGAAAHEIGHLLLGATHAPAGLMRSIWSDDELRLGRVPLFELSSDEARRIVQRLRASQPSPASDITASAGEVLVLR